MVTLHKFALCIGCTVEKAEPWYEPMMNAIKEFGVKNIPMFLAQVGHETGSLSQLEENLNYSSQGMMNTWPSRFPSVESTHFYEHSPERLANLVYGERNGNGAYETGDGWHYRGRSPIMLTGKSNYWRAELNLGYPLLEHPELAVVPEVGSRLAAWYWKERGLDTLDGVQAVTRAINGGKIGMVDRQTRYDHAVRILGLA